MMLLVLLFFVGGANAALFFPTSQEACTYNTCYSVISITRQLISAYASVHKFNISETGSFIQTPGLRRGLAEGDFVYYAYHHLEAGGSAGYYGVSVTMDVYALSLRNDQYSLTAVQINTGRDDIIRIGLEVYPRLYGGDSRSHLSATWTNDGYRKTNCINTNCPVGFQPEAGAPFVLGGIIEPRSIPNGTKKSLTIKVIKDGASGDWLVHCGLNSDPTLIGRFPKSLFTGGLADRVTTINVGGIASGSTTDLPRMGSGYLPTNDSMATAMAASCSNIQIFNENWQPSLVPDNLPTYLSSDSYSATPVINGKFFYGGPF